MTQGNTFGYLRRCMDKRFVEASRRAFEKVAGLSPVEYWDESCPGGTAVAVDEKGVRYAVAHGAAIFGWQAHGDGCGGQPGVNDEEIQQRLDAEIAKLKAEFPGTHYRIFCSEDGVDIREV